MKQIFKQIKDLPFQRAGSIWEIEDGRVKVNGINYTFCSPPVHLSLVEYFTNDDGILDLPVEYFQLTKSIDEQILELKNRRGDLREHIKEMKREITKCNNYIKSIDEKLVNLIDL